MASCELSDLNCELHPNMLGLVTIDDEGKVHWHSHYGKAAFVAVLGEVVDLLRAELLSEAEAA